jgi:hypothetical protein
MIEGSGSGSGYVHLTNGSGSRRPKTSHHWKGKGKVDNREGQGKNIEEKEV